jgi:hypothetical protein
MALLILCSSNSFKIFTFFIFLMTEAMLLPYAFSNFVVLGFSSVVSSISLPSSNIAHIVTGVNRSPPPQGFKSE